MEETGTTSDEHQEGSMSGSKKRNDEQDRRAMKSSVLTKTMSSTQASVTVLSCADSEGSLGKHFRLNAMDARQANFGEPIEDNVYYKVCQTRTGRVGQVLLRTFSAGASLENCVGRWVDSPQSRDWEVGDTFTFNELPPESGSSRNGVSIFSEDQLKEIEFAESNTSPPGIGIGEDGNADTCDDIERRPNIRRRTLSSSADRRVEMDDEMRSNLDNTTHLSNILRQVKQSYLSEVKKGTPVFNSNYIDHYQTFTRQPFISQSTLDKLLVLCLLIPDKDKHYDLLHNVIVQGADVNWASFYGFGQRPVHFAARYGHIKCLRLLLEYNANPSLTDDEGRTALHIGAIYYNISIVRLLLEQEINIDIEDRYGRTALHAAIESIQGIELEITDSADSRMFFLHHAFDMIDKDGNGHARLSDVKTVFLNRGVNLLIDFEDDERIDFDGFLELLDGAQQEKLLSNIVKTKTDNQNELIRLLLSMYPTEEAKLTALESRDHHGQVAFGVSARQRWYIENYKEMKEIFQNPVEEGHDSEIFQDPRTMLAVRMEWDSLVKHERMLRWFNHLIFAVLLSTYVFAITWKLSRKIASFEVGLKQGLIYQEYDEHNTEAFFDIESLEEWWQWSNNVLIPEVYPPGVPVDFLVDGKTLDRRVLPRHLRRHNMLLGDVKLRFVRQYPFDNCTTIYKQGMLVDVVDEGACFDVLKLKEAKTPETWRIGPLNLTYQRDYGMAPQFTGQATTLSDRGYVYYMPRDNKTRAMEVMHTLQTHHALDNLNTRAIIVEFVVYNPHLSLFSVVTLVTESIVSGAVVPNVHFMTYQMLPYSVAQQGQLIMLEVIVYLLMINQIFTWVQDLKVRRSYKGSKMFKDHIQNNKKYRSGVAKWFYPWIIPSRYSRAHSSFSGMVDTSFNNRKNRKKSEYFGQTQIMRKCYFKHTDDHVCKNLWKNPNTGVKEFTFERHCTQYVLPVPFTSLCLVWVESEIPRAWPILRGYGSFCFDHQLYYLGMALMYIVSFLLHMLQIGMASHLFSSEENVYQDQGELFYQVSRYTDIIKWRTAIFSLMLFFVWSEALRNVALLIPTLMKLMMIIQGMTYKLLSWFLLSIFLFFAFTSVQYITFGSEQGVKTATEFLVESFILASGQGEFQLHAENLTDTMFQTIAHVIFIILFPIIIMNLLIAFMSEAYESVKKSAASRFCYMQFEQVQFDQMVKSNFQDSSDRHLLGAMVNLVGLGRRRQSRVLTEMPNHTTLKRQMATWGQRGNVSSAVRTVKRALSRGDVRNSEQVSFHSRNPNELMKTVTHDKWTSDVQKGCEKCHGNFSVTNRRHHCRYCGSLLCHNCSRWKVDEKRACFECVTKWKAGKNSRNGKQHWKTLSTRVMSNRTSSVSKANSAVSVINNTDIDLPSFGDKRRTKSDLV